MTETVTASRPAKPDPHHTDIDEERGHHHGGSIATLINDCRLGAIQAMLEAKPELAAVFIHLGAELMATAGEEVVIEAAITNPSKAIALISALA